MSERYDENAIIAYVEGDLGPDDRARFERALGADAQLRSLVEDLLRQRRALREWPDEPAPAEVMEGVNQRLERDMLLEPAAAAAVATGPIRLPGETPGRRPARERRSENEHECVGDRPPAQKQDGDVAYDEKHTRNRNDNVANPRDTLYAAYNNAACQYSCGGAAQNGRYAKGPVKHDSN